MEDVTAASPSAILATRRHAKLVSNMQGYPSSSWVPGAGRGRGGKGKNEWSYGDTRGEAKGEGKTKNKGKKGKGRWDNRPNWDTPRSKDWEKNKEKPEEKPK